MDDRGGIAEETRRRWALRDASACPAGNRPVSRKQKRRALGLKLADRMPVLRGYYDGGSTRAERLAGALERVVADHGWIRMLRLNLHEIAPGIWRSAQPNARQLARLKQKLGIATVVNLRGARDRATYADEAAACARLGIDLIDFPMRSRIAPSPERLAALCDLFATAPRPMLVHCKTGADRTGFAAATCLLSEMRSPPDEAARQLALRYGHLRTTRAGVLGAVLRAHAAAHARSGVTLADWAAGDYDPAAIQRHYAMERGSSLVPGLPLRGPAAALTPPL